MDDMISRQTAMQVLDETLEGVTKGLDKESDIYNIVFGTVGIARCMVEKLQSEHGTNMAEVGTDLISRQQAIDALQRLRGNWNNADNAVDKCISTIDLLPSAEPQTEINMAYMRGKIDGINYCTERLREMRMEVEHDNG